MLNDLLNDKKKFLHKFINFQTFRKQEGPQIPLKYMDK